MVGVVQVGRAIESALTPEGMNLITSSGAVAEQTVYHLHLHVVPRYRKDGFGKIWPPKDELEGVDLEGVADRIRDAWGAAEATSTGTDNDENDDGRDRQQEVEPEHREAEDGSRP